MKKLTGHSISEVRKRVRQYLIAEANNKDVTRNRGVGSTGEESPESVMLRFKTSLDNAVPGDVFWLSYGIAEYAPLTDSERENLGASPSDLRFSTAIYDSMVAALMGKHTTMSDDEINRQPADEKQVTKTLQNASSSFASSKRLMDMGLKEIKTIQEKRITTLSSLANRVKLGSAPAANLIDELKKIIVLSPDIVASLRSGEQSERQKALNVLRASMGRGEIKLTQAYIDTENLLISAAEMVAYGNKLHTLSVDQTGIPGTRRLKGDALIAKEMGDANTIKKHLTGVGKQLKDGKFERGEEYKSTNDVVDILIGGCVSLLTFDGPKIKITSGDAHGRLERDGLPMPVLQSIVSLLLWEITYGAAKLSTYISNPQVAGSFALWAEHLDPEHTVEIAEGFIGNGDLAYNGSASGKSLRPGFRTSSHWDPQTDAIINAALKVMPGTSVPTTAADGTAGYEFVPGANPDTITDAQISQIISSLGDLGTEITPTRVKSVLKARKIAAAEKSVLANLSDTRSKADYEKRKKTSPAALAEEVSMRAVFNESEKRIYQDILRRMLFGVTLRCVGKDLETQISSAKQTEAEKSLNLQGGSARLGTQRSFPIFEARIERPKQTYIRTVQDTETLSKMTSAASHLGLTDLKIFKGGGSPLESASAKLGSAGEATAISGRPAQHRSEILTPNLKIKLSDSALEEAIRGGNVAGLLGASSSYVASKPFKVPYVEKITTNQKNMTVEDVMSLERVYDKKLKPLKVTVQLLGAKKFHDDDNAGKAVSTKYLKIIPEMGIIPVGVVLSDDVRLSQKTKDRIKSEIAPAAVSFLKNETGIDSNPQSFASFDLRDRLIKDPNAGGYGSLTSEIENMIKRLRYEIRAESNLGTSEHKKGIERQMLRLLQSSHGSSASVLDSRVSAQLIKNSLGTVLIKAKSISSRSASEDIKTAAAATTGFGGLLAGARITDSKADQALGLASKGLYGEVLETTSFDKVPAVSLAINAALATLTKSSEETIESYVVRMTSSGKFEDPAAESGYRMYPRAMPLLTAFDLASKAAEKLIKDFKDLEVEEVLNRITKTHMSDMTSTDVDADQTEIDLAGLGEQLEDLSDKLADLRSEGAKDAKALNDLMKGIESLASELSSPSVEGRLKGNALLPPMSGWNKSNFAESRLASLISIVDKNTAVADNEINGYLTRLRSIMSEDSINSAKSLVASLRETVLSASSLREDLVTTLEESRSSGYHGATEEERDNSVTLQMITRLDGLLKGMQEEMDTVVKRVQEIDSVMSQAGRARSAEAAERVPLANTVLDLSEVASLIGANQVDDLVKSVIELSESLIGDDLSESLIGDDESVSKPSIVSVAASILHSSIGSSNLAKSLGNISTKTAARSMQDPVAVTKAYKEKAQIAGLTEDQSILFKSIIQKTSVGGMAKLTDPYEVAKMIIIGTMKSTSTAIRALSEHLLNAFFPFVSLTKAEKLVGRGGGEALTSLNYEITTNARSRSIITALDSANKLKRLALEGDSRALDRLRELGVFLEQSGIKIQTAPESDLTQVTQSDDSGVTSQTIRSPKPDERRVGEQGTIDKNTNLASLRGRVSPEVKAQQSIARAAAQKQGTPAIRADSTGTTSVEVGNAASYMSAATSVAAADDMGTNVTIKSASGEEVPLSDTSLDYAINAIASKESKVTNPDGADLAAIQTALEAARSVIDDLNTRQGKSSNTSVLPISLAPGYIRSSMKNLFPGERK